jgi:hypothetical protein
MKMPQRKHLKWIIAALGVLAIATGLVIYANRSTREVMFLLKFAEPAGPAPVKQDEIDAALGKGYEITFSDAYGSQESPKSMKIVGLRIPAEVPEADVAAKLNRLPHVKSVDVMTKKR